MPPRPAFESIKRHRVVHHKEILRDNSPVYAELRRRHEGFAERRDFSGLLACIRICVPQFYAIYFLMNEGLSNAVL